MTFQISKQQSLIIKAVAIIFVIMSHTGVFPCGGAIGVHLFLIVSGYGIYCSLEKGTDDYWKRRNAPRLYPQNYPTYFKWMANFFNEHPEYKIVHSHIDSMSYLPLLAAKKAGIPVRIQIYNSIKKENAL